MGCNYNFMSNKKKFFRIKNRITHRGRNVGCDCGSNSGCHGAKGARRWNFNGVYSQRAWGYRGLSKLS